MEQPQRGLRSERIFFKKTLILAFEAILQLLDLVYTLFLLIFSIINPHCAMSSLLLYQNIRSSFVNQISYYHINFIYESNLCSLFDYIYIYITMYIVI